MNVIISSRHFSEPHETAPQDCVRDEADRRVVRVEWHRPLFFHFALDAAVVRPRIPAAFELELHEGRAIVSLVALTMRRFRSGLAAPVWMHLLRGLPEQRFFNLRTYVRHRGERGAFFLWSWLSRPWSLPMPATPFGLTCSFANSRYDHAHESGILRGAVRASAGPGRFEYEARMQAGAGWTSCAPGSLAEFALERYIGYFHARGTNRVFRTWHPPWRQVPIQTRIEDGLVPKAFPWFASAEFLEAHYSPGLAQVRIGPPGRLAEPPSRHRVRVFFESP